MSDEPKLRPPCKRYMQVFCRVAVEGRSREEVARELNLKPESVSDIVFRVRKYFRECGAQMMKVDPRMARAITVREIYLARLEHQWQEAMQAWYRSKEPVEVKKAVTTTNSSGQEEKRVEKATNSRAGDYRYLAIAREILADMREISINRPYAPKEQNHVRLLTLKQREEEIDRLLAEETDDQRAAPPTDVRAA